MSCHSPFRLTTWLAAVATAGVALLTPPCVEPVRAQAGQQATLSDKAKTEITKPLASPTTGAGNVAAVDPSAAGAPAQRSITSKAIETVKEVAKSATDIFSRVPCLPSKGTAKMIGSLPRVASKLAAGQPVLIIAFGSSSTNGHGASSPEFRYPNRLAAQLRRQYPAADISVLIRAKGGEDAPEMMKRLQTEVLDMKPDLVIWQVGTNAVLRNLDPAETASKLVKLLGKVAELRHVGVFPRFEVMRDWHERQAIPMDNFVISDGLHMNDWGYACFAQLLGDDIIKSVGQIKLGVNVPSDVRTYRPM